MMQVRPATDSDGPAIARLIADVFADYENCPFDRTEFPELDAPASHYSARGGALFVGEVEAHPFPIAASLAYSVPEQGTAELHKFYLDKSLRGRRMGFQIYERVLSEIRSRGLRRIRLWTDTRFHSGHRFYERAGFARQPVTRFLDDVTQAWEYAYTIDLKPA